jgi:nucleolar protein 56
MHEDLQTFLLNNVPRGKKKKGKVTLGVSDSKLGSVISETLEIHCQIGGVVNEVMRGVRLYFHKLVEGLPALAAAKAQLGLGHSYSRAKVKFNVHRSDNMIIQTISLLDQLDKDINTFAMRIREWYSYHFPELIKIVPDNQMYARVARYIGDRKSLNEEKMEGLEEIVLDSTKAQAIVEAARMSMGMDVSPLDLVNIQRFASRVVELADYRKKLASYLSSKMSSVAPNLTTLIGEQVGARLISHAGSLTSLAKYPASTVQILGAEKALFRALKTKGNTPKYGLIFHSTFIGRAGAKNKGRISRYLANKCSIASRIDCFSEQPTTVFGEKLRDQVEERLSFFESGELPRKNIAVMQEAISQLQADRMDLSLDASFTAGESGGGEKKKKKKRKRKETEEEGESGETEVKVPVAADPEDPTPKKKKKKRKSLQQPED